MPRKDPMPLTPGLPPTVRALAAPSRRASRCARPAVTRRQPMSKLPMKTQRFQESVHSRLGQSLPRPPRQGRRPHSSRSVTNQASLRRLAAPTKWQVMVAERKQESQKQRPRPPRPTPSACATGHAGTTRGRRFRGSQECSGSRCHPSSLLGDWALMKASSGCLNSSAAAPMRRVFSWLTHARKRRRF